MYTALLIAKETGTQWEPGGLAAQPQWWIDLLGWFIPVYDDNKFYSRAKNLMGDGKKGSSGPSPASEGLARGRDKK